LRDVSCDVAYCALAAKLRYGNSHSCSMNVVFLACYVLYAHASMFLYIGWFMRVLYVRAASKVWWR